MYIYLTDADLINVTITNNSYNVSSDHIGGLCVLGHSSINVVNSIITGNGDNSIICRSWLGTHPSLTVGWSDVEAGEDGIIGDSLSTINWLEGNIDEDPLFVGGEPYSYFLKPESPCIDAGTAFLEFNGDTIVNYSPEEYDGIAPDMGAFGIYLVDMIKQEMLIPKKFQLYQNYPNPFNNTTTISYRLAKPGHVNLSIYDITGQLVQVLEDGNQLANTYRFIWNASRYASGIYFVRLSTDKQTAIRKILLVK
jgi:hypothetical protein